MVIHIFLMFSPSSAGVFFVYTLALGEVSANIWRNILCVRKYSEWYRISVLTHGRRWLIISYEAGTWKSSDQLLLPTLCFCVLHNLFGHREARSRVRFLPGQWPPTRKHGHGFGSYLATAQSLYVLMMIKSDR